MVPMLGVRSKYDNSRQVNVLRIQPIPLRRTLVETAYSLIERGIVEKKY